jgi:hypothetical protein
MLAPITIEHVTYDVGGVRCAADLLHAIDEVLKAYERAWQPKRLELLPVDEIGLSIEPGLGMSMDLAVEFLDQHNALRQPPGLAAPATSCERPARLLCAVWALIHSAGSPLRNSRSSAWRLPAPRTARSLGSCSSALVRWATTSTRPIRSSACPLAAGWLISLFD